MPPLLGPPAHKDSLCSWPFGGKRGRTGEKATATARQRHKFSPCTFLKQAAGDLNSEPSLEHCVEICPPVQFYFKKLNYKKSGGIFVKLVDCVGYLVNLASTEYRSFTEKFKRFFIKLMDFRINFYKVQGFSYIIHGVRHDY